VCVFCERFAIELFFLTWLIMLEILELLGGVVGTGWKLGGEGEGGRRGELKNSRLGSDLDSVSMLAMLILL
jgi:hypothetical protein